MSKPAPAQIDFSKYRTPQLVESIGNLIDLRGIYARSLLKILFVTALVILLVILVFWTRMEGLEFILVVIAGFVAGNVLGGIYAVIQLVKQSLDNMLIIIGQMLEITKQVARDIRAINTGEAQTPSAKQLVKGVYGHVILPVVEQTIAERLGFVGKPVLFLYRITLGQMVRLTIKMIPASALTTVLNEGKSVEEVASETTDTLHTIAENEDRIVSALTFVQDKIHSVGNWIRFLVMLPGYSVLAIAILLVLLIFALAYFGLGHSPDPDELESAARIVRYLL